MSAARGFIGAGDLYIARYNPTLADFDDFEGPFEAGKFEIKPNVSTKEQKSKGRDTYGQVLETVTLPDPVDFTVDFNEINKQSLVNAFMGTDTALAQGSGTLTDFVILAAKGKWSDVEKMNLTVAGLTVKNSAGSVTYVLGTDYEVNYRMGWIKILTGSAIAEAASLKVSGAYGAVAGTVIQGATQSQLRVKFRLDGINLADQLPVLVDAWEVAIAPESAFDFLADNFNAVTLKGKMKTPAGKTAPFEVKLLSAAI